MKKILIILFFLLETGVGIFFWNKKLDTTRTQKNPPPTVTPKITTETLSAKTGYDKKPQFFPAEAYGTFFQGYDFNRDGKDEYIAYYHQKIILNGKPTEKQYLNIYRFDGTDWVIDHADEGTQGEITLDKDEFLTFTDIDNDGTPEVKITKHIDGTGNYRQSYFLIWNGTKISEVFLPHLADIIKKYNLTSYLQDDETFAGVEFFTRNGNYIKVCGNDFPECSFRNSTPNARTPISFDAVRKNGVWKLSNFRRVE